MVRFRVKKNDRGLYAEAEGYGFALIDRRALDKVKEGEKWLGEAVRFIKDRRGNEVPVIVPQKRLLRYSGLENGVYSGSVRLFSFEEALEKGVIRKVNEEKELYDYRPGFKKTKFVLSEETPYGVFEENYTFTKWETLKPLKAEEIDREREWLKELFKEVAEEGKEVQEKLSYLEERIKELEMKIRETEYELEHLRVSKYLGFTDGTVYYDGEKTYKGVKDQRVSKGMRYLTEGVNLMNDVEVEDVVERIPVEVSEELLRELKNRWNAKKKSLEAKLKVLKKEKELLSGKEKRLKEEKEDLVTFYRLYRYVFMEEERFTDTDYFFLPEYLYRHLHLKEPAGDETVFEKLSRYLGKIPETPQGVAFGLAVLGIFEGIQPERLALWELDGSYFGSTYEAGLTALEYVEKWLKSPEITNTLEP